MKRIDITVKSEKANVAAFTVKVNEYETVNEAVEKLGNDTILTFINEREVIRKGDRARQLAAKGHKVEEIQQVLDGELKLRRAAVALTPEKMLSVLGTMSREAFEKFTATITDETQRAQLEMLYTLATAKK